MRRFKTTSSSTGQRWFVAKSGGTRPVGPNIVDAYRLRFYKGYFVLEAERRALAEVVKATEGTELHVFAPLQAARVERHRDERRPHALKP